MLLNAFNQDNSIKFKKINQFLKENYNLYVDDKVDLGQCQYVLKNIISELHEMKTNGLTAKDSEFSKKMLIAEALKILVVEGVEQLLGSKFYNLMPQLAQKAIELIEIGDTLDEAVTSIMKEYRSSPYRWDDSIVETEIRKLINQHYGLKQAFPINDISNNDLKIIQDWLTNTGKIDENIFKKLSNNKNVSEEFVKGMIVVESGIYLKNILSENVWDIVSKEQQQAADAYLKAKKSSLSLEPKEDEQELIRAYTQKQRDIQKQKGEKMKEGYLRDVRTLLESEVEQAEVLISAKSFGDQLQTMMEKLGRLQNEDLPPVGDQMREVYGMHISQAFMDMMMEQMNQIMSELRATKEKIDSMVSDIARGTMPTNDMDDVGEEDLDLGIDDELETAPEGEEMLDIDAELETVPDEPMGRPTRESVQLIAKQLTEAKVKLQKLKNIRAKETK